MNLKLKKQKIIHADCRIAIKQIQDKSVSLILTDPPYFIDGMSSDWDRKKLEHKKSKAGVIGSLPVGMKFSPHQSIELKDFLTPVARQWMKVLKPAGFVLCFTQPRLSHSVASALEDSGFHIKDLYVWKRHGQAKAFTHNHFINKRKDLTRREKEYLITSIAGRKTPQLKPDAEMIVMAQAPPEGRLVDNWNKYQTGFIDVNNQLIEPGSFPSTIISCPKPKNRYGHITAKPVDLLRHLIRIFCHPDGLVLDTFAGCGSCAEACVIENYNYIGFEIESQYAQTAIKRIKYFKEEAQKNISTIKNSIKRSIQDDQKRSQKEFEYTWRDLT